MSRPTRDSSAAELEQELVQAYANLLGINHAIDRLRKYSLRERMSFHKRIREKKAHLTDEVWNEAEAKINRIYNALGDHWGCEDETDEQRKAEDKIRRACPELGVAKKADTDQKKQSPRSVGRQKNKQNQSSSKKNAPFRIPKGKLWTELRWRNGQYNTYLSAEMRYRNASEMKIGSNRNKKYRGKDYKCTLIGFASTMQKAQKLGEKDWEKLTDEQQKKVLAGIKQGWLRL